MRERKKEATIYKKMRERKKEPTYITSHFGHPL